MVYVRQFRCSHSGTIDSVASPVSWEVGATSAASLDGHPSNERQIIPREWIGRKVIMVMRIPAEARVFAFQFAGCLGS